ncbi:nucleic acid-binding protein [Hypoxylon fragiforme]|uniref:nucleic acid-binding protein n=1 Tax=Hypoxylon fragiforme TaxID=63214 RepID=UPI0020C62F8F|nr:nucleic acid-binding protein [Hypoxylon fragiforme]KAI2602975.1 nucleic acid-binding protein [Hypoxylon fragiforme]
MNVTTELAGAARHAHKIMKGIVVSAGRMDKTVKVKLGGLRWEEKVQKYFKQPRCELVHDPRNSLRQGDVVSITSSWRVSKDVRYVVQDIIAPFGDPIDERPPIPTLEERIQERSAKREIKVQRRDLTRSVNRELLRSEKLALQVNMALRPIQKALKTESSQAT